MWYRDNVKYKIKIPMMFSWITLLRMRLYFLKDCFKKKRKKKQRRAKRDMVSDKNPGGGMKISEGQETQGQTNSTVSPFQVFQGN